MSKWINITDTLTPAGLKKLQVGQVLVFNYEGSRNEYKIMRIRNGNCWVKPVTLHLPENVNIVDKEEIV